MFENIIETIKKSIIPLVSGGIIGIAIMLFQASLKDAAPYVAEGVYRLCDLGLTQDQRLSIRAEINKMLAAKYEGTEHALDPAVWNGAHCPGDIKPE